MIMKRMSIITPSYAPDFELCSDLHRSVLEYSPESVHHHIIVPRADVELFRRLSGSRTHVRSEADFLPASFIPVPLTKLTVNLRHPIPPIRGWILQQLVKLAAVAESDDDVTVIVDSDIEFVRPFGADTFIQDGVVRLYRKPNAIDQRMPHHMTWHRVARGLLGLEPSAPPYPDYISSLLAWNPAIVRQMLAKVTAVTGRPWTTAIGGQLYFSEWTLYGLFVDHVSGEAARSFVSDDQLCLSYWNDGPLNRQGAIDLLRTIRPTDIAAMISSKSRTPLATRRAAFAEHRLASRTPLPLGDQRSDDELAKGTLGAPLQRL
jgi:hypothetical protein